MSDLWRSKRERMLEAKALDILEFLEYPADSVIAFTIEAGSDEVEIEVIEKDANGKRVKGEDDGTVTTLYSVNVNTKNARKL